MRGLPRRLIGISIAALACWLALGFAQVSVVRAGSSSHTGAGDDNAGDVWVDAAGNPAGPGHENDPHLGCNSVDIWGANMADSGGSFTIALWPPSGSQQTIDTGSWSYDTATGGTQLIATVSYSTLSSAASAAGASTVNGQIHLRLTVFQDPVKHKVFWIGCAGGGGGGVGGATATPTPTPAPGSSSSATPTPSGGTGGVGGVSTSPTPTAGATATPSGTGGTGGAGATGGTGGATTAGGVQGVSASASPASGTGGATGGVLGISTTAPVAGAGIALGSLLLILAGLALVRGSRLRRRAG